jgi:hypothetical protein
MSPVEIGQSINAMAKLSVPKQAILSAPANAGGTGQNMPVPF